MKKLRDDALRGNAKETRGAQSPKLFSSVVAFMAI